MLEAILNKTSDSHCNSFVSLPPCLPASLPPSQLFWEIHLVISLVTRVRILECIASVSLSMLPI